MIYMFWSRTIIFIFFNKQGIFILPVYNLISYSEAITQVNEGLN